MRPMPDDGLPLIGRVPGGRRGLRGGDAQWDNAGGDSGADGGEGGVEGRGVGGGGEVWVGEGCYWGPLHHCMVNRVTRPSASGGGVGGGG